MKARPIPVRLAAGAFLLAASVAAAGLSAQSAPAQSVPDRPPRPLPVFVDAVPTEDAELRPLLAKAVEEVERGVSRRRRWFRAVPTREEAAVTVRVTNYRTVSEYVPKQGGVLVRQGMVMSERHEIVEFHFVDAVAAIGETTRSLAGLDQREIGTSLRNASNHLAEELERFCRDNYAALTRPPQ